MQVPLDFYRILGVPIQATPEQIKQAYRDRLQQLPRIQYSQVAISARKQLLDEAYTVLSDAERRQAYDRELFAEIYGEEPAAELASPLVHGIEIQEEQLPGALLLLQELGEYELVLRLAEPVLQEQQTQLQPLTEEVSPPAVSPERVDIYLTTALAYLELGREYWQKNQYETAAQSLQVGLDWLHQEQILAGVRAEILAELDKLRPYRILDLLSRPRSQQAERTLGLTLLKDMLAAREGIEGTGNDQSGLSIEDFLKFIQQLRIYLSVEEQQELFEAEAQRPSAVATYLAVYAMVARGFHKRQPALIRRARTLLMRLQEHQDVYLEQAICALLLGQPQAAQQVLELSQEYESLAFIREYSEESPDLVPGLYLYTERWLKEEVYPYFQDLADQPVALKGYFMDEQVQRDLEAFTAEADAPGSTSVERTGASAAVSPSPSKPSGEPGGRKSAALQLPLQSLSRGLSQPPFGSWLSKSSSPSSASTTDSPQLPPSPPANDRRDEHQGIGEQITKHQLQVLRGRARSRGKRSPLGFLGVMTVGIAGMVLVAIAVLRQTQPQLEDPPAAPRIEPVSSSVATPTPSLPGPPAALTQEAARQVIQTWQTLKAQALGPDHAINQLEQILTGSALTTWQTRAKEGQANNWYWQYQLSQLLIERVEQQAPDRARVVATIRETANFYDRGKLQPGSSYTAPYRAEYSLVRQQGRWQIQAMRVL